MSRLFRTFLLFFSLLLSLSEGAMGVSTAAQENRVWSFSAIPDTTTREIGSQAAGGHWGNDPCGYEGATDVGVYVHQNPWTKFDPLGLREKKKEKLTNFAKTTERTSRELKAGDVFGLDSDVPRNNRDLSKQTDGINGVAADASANYWNNDLQNVAEGGARSVRDVANGFFDIGGAVSMAGTVVKVVKGGLGKLLGETAKEVAEEGAENAAKTRPSTDYSHIADPKNVTASTKPTPRQVRQMKEANRAQNGGVLRDDVTGEVGVDSPKSMKGVTPPPNSIEVDHIVPVDAGGTRAQSNLQLLLKTNNRKKWNNVQ